SRAHIEAILCQKCNIPTLRSFQITHALDLVNGKDLFLVIVPGMGKTLIMAAPLLVSQFNGERGIALVIVPLKILTEQQVKELRSH
ncbi:hypothetical protein C8Q78DRAFT_952629, partial [Trametes maxima]